MLWDKGLIKEGQVLQESAIGNKRGGYMLLTALATPVEIMRQSNPDEHIRHTYLPTLEFKKRRKIFFLL